MDSYGRLKQILFKWVRFVARALGHDIPNYDYVPNAYTYITTLHGVCFPFMYLWTIFHFDGKLSLQGIAYLGNACQVSALLFFRHELYTFI